MTDHPHIIIIGAGVIGLQAALSLLTTPETSHFNIAIIAEQLPDTKHWDLGSDYSSPNSGGYWNSQATCSHEDAEIREWEERTYDFWRRELKGEEDEGEEVESYENRVKRVGLGFVEHQAFWLKETKETEGHDGRGLWWKNVVDGFEVLDVKAEASDEVRTPPGAIFGVRYQTISINSPKYLEYLLKSVRELGATVINATLNVKGGIEGVIKDARHTLYNGR